MVGSFIALLKCVYNDIIHSHGLEMIFFIYKTDYISLGFI